LTIGGRSKRALKEFRMFTPALANLLVEARA
jgi:hypothetical protein